MISQSKSLVTQLNSKETVTIQNEIKKTENNDDIQIQESSQQLNKCTDNILLQEIINVESDIEIKNQNSLKKCKTAAKIDEKVDYGIDTKQYQLQFVYYMSGFAKLNKIFGDDAMEIRGDAHKFVKHVYQYLLIIHSISAAFVILVCFEPSLNNYFIENASEILAFGLLSLIILNIFMTSRRFQLPPNNVVILILAVVITTSMNAAAAVRISYIFLFTLIVVVVVDFGCFWVSLKTLDFTHNTIYFLVVGIVLLTLPLILLVPWVFFGLSYSTVYIIMTVCASWFTVTMMIRELKMILRGDDIKLNVNDHVTGAYMVYMAVITLFMHLLGVYILLEYF